MAENQVLFSFIFKVDSPQQTIEKNTSLFIYFMAKKKTLWLKLRYRLEYIVARPMVTCMHYMPLPFAYYLGRLVGWCSWKIARNRRAIVAQNLTAVNVYMGQAASKLTLEQQVREVFLRTGASIACCFRFVNMKPEKFKQHIKMEGLEHFKTALAQEKGVLILLAHMGPWEVLPYLPYLFQSTSKLGAMYRPMNNEYFDTWFKSVREQKGTRLFSHKDGFNKPVDFLRSGGVIGVLADQGMRQGTIAPFFGKDVPTNPLPGLFQRRSGAPAIGFSVITSKPLQWTIKAFPVNYPTRKEDRTREKEAKVSNQAIEKALLESPLDGFWLRKRL